MNEKELKEYKMNRIETNMREIMELLEIPFTESTKGTPKRIAKMYLNEVFQNRNNHNLDELNDKMKTFPNEQRGVEELIIIKDIPFFSMCEHHFMPFQGKVTVGYVPNQKIIGLSKIPRVVKYFSKQPQLQERLVNDIADYLYEILDCDALYVLATETTHTCVQARGIETYCEVDAIACRGAQAKDYKQEFYTRIRR